VPRQQQPQPRPQQHLVQPQVVHRVQMLQLPLQQQLHLPELHQPPPQPPLPQLDVENKSLRWPDIRTEYVLILFLLKPLG